MDDSYDTGAAQKALTGLITTYIGYGEPENNDHLSLFMADHYEINLFSRPNVYKLVRNMPGTSDVEEATFTVHGIVLEKEFPPIQLDRQSQRDEGSKQRYAGYIHQYIALTGLGIPEFNDTLTGLARIHKYFKDVLHNKKLEVLEPFVFNGHLALACHTRYFMPRCLCRLEVPQPFGLGIDPHGDLECIAGDSHIHTEDNIVQYLGHKMDEGKSVQKYININPMRFQKGDLMAITVSFFCIRMRMEKYKMMTSLKTVLLLDDKICEKAQDDNVKALLGPNTPRLQVKHRFIETDGDDRPAHRHGRMDLT